ncbi:caspase family protein [Bacteroidota bacterium]
MVIGISKYKNPSNNLQYAQKDATDFKNALIKHGRFKKENIKLLTNKNASRENIRKNLEGWLKSKLKKNDLLIIFFSGHGTQIADTDEDEEDGLDECLVPYDFNSNDASSVIIDDLFAYWIKNLKSERVMIIFDNCYSGGAAKQKGVSIAGVKGNIGKDNFSKDISREVPRKGTVLLAASKADQVSFESNEFKNGVFTYFLINSISLASDNDFNKIINSSELYYATRKSTLEYTKNQFKKEQEPIYIDWTDDGLELFYLPNENPMKIGNKEIEALEYRIEQLVEEEKDFSKKIIIYKELYDTDPYNIIYNHRLGMLYVWNNEYLKAIEHYKYITSVKNSAYSISPPIELDIARLHKSMGEYELAEFYYLEAMKKEPNNPRFYNELAGIYLSQKDTLSTIQQLNKSISIQPLQKKPYLSLYYFQIGYGKFDAANKIISRGYQINPNDFETIYAYSMTQRYFLKSQHNDTIIVSIENDSGIKKKWAEITAVDPKIIYYSNGKKQTIEEVRLSRIRGAIAEYPYYPEFYKHYIQYVKDNNIDIDISKYTKKYLLYSKLNPDSTFIQKYIVQE